MRTVIGALLMLAGVVFGIWAGVWWAFIGGIVMVIEQIRAPHIEALQVAFGIARIVFAGVIGWAAAGLLIIPGQAMLRD